MKLQNFIEQGNLSSSIYIKIGYLILRDESSLKNAKIRSQLFSIYYYLIIDGARHSVRFL